MLSAWLLAAGCATTTVINSDPPGAKILENGRELGETPYSYTTEDWLWESRDLTLESSGYVDSKILLKRSKVNPPIAIVAGALFVFTGGVCFWASIPIFLAGGMDYPPETYVKMTPDKRGRSTSSTDQESSSSVEQLTY